MTDTLLPNGAEVAFEDVESALAGANDEARRAAGMALTATIVVAGPYDRLAEASRALNDLKDVGVRTVLISYGDQAAPPARVAHRTVALEGLRPEYLNNAVAALRLSSLPTLVWWRGGNVHNIEGLASLADRLVLDAVEPEHVWSDIEKLVQHTAVSDLRWTRLTRWRALMAHFFDIPEVRAAASGFRTLTVEGSDPHAARLLAGWLMSTVSKGERLALDARREDGAAPITAVRLGEGTQQLELRLTASRTCVETTAQVAGVGSASRIVSLGDQGLAALLGEELRIRARDMAFERAVAASRAFA